jgi:predicted nucleic acid-binding protein
VAGAASPRRAAYSYVDATSFAIIRSLRLRLRHALAFDGDFAAAGFVEVLT